MTKLRIADNLSLPVEAVTSTFALMGIRGSGKTHTATVMVEEMLKRGQVPAIYDPTGAWFGLKSSADGGREGFPVVVFGGENADVPLEETAGETVASVIVAKRVPAILDVSLMRKGARVRFMTDFCEALYHKNREPLHFVADEAHTIAPQKPFPEVARLLGAMEDIILQGRRRGLGATIISQRPALVNKNILTQCGTLIAMRVVGPQDRRAIEDWIEAHGDEEKAKELLDSLPTLKLGEGWVWSPGLSNALVRVRFRQRETFDSSATPKVGEKVAAPKAKAEIDLDALGEQIRATVQKAKENDPKELRRRLAELEKQLRERPSAEVKVERVEVPVLSSEQTGAVQETLRTMRGFQESLPELVRSLEAALGRAIEGRSHPIAAHQARPSPQPIPPSPRPSPRPPVAPANGDTSTLSRAERAILAAVAQRHPTPCSRIQASVLSGYSVTSSSFANALGALRSKGYVAGLGDDNRITEGGLGALGPFDAPPSGQELIRWWAGKLGKAERTFLEIIAGAYPGGVSKEQLSERSGYSITSSSFANALGKLRSLELVEGRGEIRASAAFFE